MRLHILSDLRLGVRGMRPPAGEADVTILAGDIWHPPSAAMAWAATLGRPVLYVPGNHEFYGGSIPEVRRALARSARKHGIQLLDQGTRVIGGVRFVGATLWTDFALFGVEGKSLAMTVAAQFMRNFTVIRNADGSAFTPADTCALFAEQYAWLASVLQTPFEGPTVVITHHAPTKRPPAFRRFAAQRRIRHRLRRVDGTGRAVDPRPHPRQFRLHGGRHSRGVQSARLLPRRRGRESCVRSVPVPRCPSTWAGIDAS